MNTSYQAVIKDSDFFKTVGTPACRAARRACRSRANRPRSSGNECCRLSPAVPSAWSFAVRWAAPGGHPHSTPAHSARCRTPGRARRVRAHPGPRDLPLRLGPPLEPDPPELGRRAGGRISRRALPASSAGARNGASISSRRADVRRRTPAWRRYVCESFCDTSAWLCAGLRPHDEYTLAAGPPPDPPALVCGPPAWAPARCPV